MDKHQIKILVLLLFILSACWAPDYNDQAKDDFYDTFGGWDWIRIPLIKPYAAKKVDPEIKTNPWIINFQSKSLINADNVKMVSVRDSVLYILSGKVDGSNDSTALGTRNVPTAWYVINTKKKTETGFSKEKEFNTYISKNNYPHPQWYSLDSLAESLRIGKKLPWRPD